MRAKRLEHPQFSFEVGITEAPQYLEVEWGKV
jgi:hypothetical protein